MAIVVARDAEALQNYLADWEDLAAESVEPNIFYEPWMLLPALRAFGAGVRLKILLVFSTRKSAANSPRILTGLFVFEQFDRWRCLRVGGLRLWNYPYCYLATPLVRRGYADDCIAELMGWLGTPSSGCSLMEFHPITADGPFTRVLQTQAEKHSEVVYVSNLRTRALFRPAATAELFLRRSIAGRHRKELRRQRRRLAEHGQVEVRRLTPSGDCDAWIDEFIAVENRGWKGASGVAVAARPADEAFFREVVKGAFARDRLMLSALTLDDRAIAVKCSFSAAPGGFAFKIGFDGSFAKYSPGMLLELDAVEHLHERHAVRWMDSCAATNHSMINRLWPDRRSTHSVLVTRGRGLLGLTVTLMPLLQFLKRSILRR